MTACTLEQLFRGGYNS